MDNDLLTAAEDYYFTNKEAVTLLLQYSEVARVQKLAGLLIVEYTLV